MTQYSLTCCAGHKWVHITDRAPKRVCPFCHTHNVTVTA